MKKLFSLGIVSLSLALAACGGDSDSSGSQSDNDNTPSTGNTTPDTPAPNPIDTSNVCESSGSDVYATESGCEFSIPNLNSGTPQTYVCESGRIRSGGISTKTLTFNGYTIQCAS